MTKHFWHRGGKRAHSQTYPNPRPNRRPAAKHTQINITSKEYQDEMTHKQGYQNIMLTLFVACKTSVAHPASPHTQ